MGERENPMNCRWNIFLGGFPFWLKEVQNITFRSDNPPFKYHMKRFSKMIVKMMKEEKLYASQGGPIILSQIANEYNNVALAYKEQGVKYVQWAGKMAVGLKTGVPWVMCKQTGAPDPVGNRRSAGFTNEERESFEKNFLSRGFVDTFRKQHPGVVGYTYWGYRHNGRKTNKGDLELSEGGEGYAWLEELEKPEEFFVVRAPYKGQKIVEH